MNNIVKYTAIQKMFESSKELIEQLKSPEVLIRTLKKYVNEGLEAYKEKNTDSFQFNNRLYQVTFDRAKKVGVNISEYPIILEALMN
ncbi:MAG: hypothetical protein ABIE36_00175 [Candidatus Diapherotrites archaeon]